MTIRAATTQKPPLLVAQLLDGHVPAILPRDLERDETIRVLQPLMQAGQRISPHGS
jgi:hypothetical protein